MAPNVAPRKPTEGNIQTPEKADSRLGSGIRKLVTDEDLERFERRSCETIPAPPDPSES